LSTRTSASHAVRRRDDTGRTSRRQDWTLAAFCVCVATVALMYNLFGSPDVLYDEAAYTWAAQQVALGWHLTLDNRPLFVHPPLSFIAQAAWLHLTGYAAAPLASAIHAARLLAATVGVADVLLIAALAYRLAGSATPLRRRVVTGAVAILAALDPVLVRYDRQNVIEPFALCASLLVLHAAWHFKHRSALAYVSITGLLGGIALLTNEITLFLVVVPPIFALLGRERRFIRRAVAALAIAVGFLATFLLWAAEIGQASWFIALQTTDIRRFVGLLQLTGLNRPGVSLVASLERSVAQYSSTYIVLTIGLAALIWCWTRRNTESGNFLTAWLTASYACGAYIVTVGTLNEQFFVYLIPAAIVGSVLLVDALVAGASRSILQAGYHRSRQTHPRLPVLLAGFGFACVFALSGTNWVVNYRNISDGVVQAVQYITAKLPACAAVNASGDSQKYEYLTGGLIHGRSFSYFSVGPAALADGVHYFLLSPTDAEERSGDMTPALESWIKANGHQIAIFPSQIYDTVQLWYVTSSPYNSVANITDIADGAYINTVGSDCGGYTVTGKFYSEYQGLGGKGVVGAPISRVGSAVSGQRTQFFDSVVLTGQSAGNSPVRPLPIVLMFADRAPAAYKKAGLPPVRLHASAAMRRSWLTNPAIRRVFLDVSGGYAAAVERYGAPQGPPSTAPGGGTEQAFADIVLEAPADGNSVHAVSLVPDAIGAGVLHEPTGSRAPQSPPPLPNPFPLGPATPTSVEPFVMTVSAVLVLYATTVGVLAWRRRGARSVTRRRSDEVA
jgi:hypothetical protein